MIPKAAAPPRIVLIGGSRSRASRTSLVLAAAAAALEAEGAVTDVCDLGCVTGAGGGNLRPRVAAADAVVLVTPTYHGSFSGLLKHALDHLERNALARKPVGLMATHGAQPTAQAAEHLRAVVRALGAVDIPPQVLAGDAAFRRSGDVRELVDADVRERIGGFARELLWYAARLTPEQAPAAAAALARSTPTVTRRVTPPEDGLRLVNGDFPDQIMRAVRYIRENFANGQVSLNTVAQEAFMSRYHFSRTFKRETGTRFIDFLTTVRLAEACALLSDGDESITSVASSVGYRDLSHFERTFKKEFGLSPSCYRGRVRAGLEVPPALPWPDRLGDAMAAA